MSIGEATYEYFFTYNHGRYEWKYIEIKNSFKSITHYKNNN